MADPTREIFVMVGDGSHLMLNSELATVFFSVEKLSLLSLITMAMAVLTGFRMPVVENPLIIFLKTVKEGDGILLSI